MLWPRGGRVPQQTKAGRAIKPDQGASNLAGAAFAGVAFATTAFAPVAYKGFAGAALGYQPSKAGTAFAGAAFAGDIRDFDPNIDVRTFAFASGPMHWLAQNAFRVRSLEIRADLFHSQYLVRLLGR